MLRERAEVRASGEAAESRRQKAHFIAAAG
jgi:hypothetical protein